MNQLGGIVQIQQLPAVIQSTQHQFTIASRISEEMYDHLQRYEAARMPRESDRVTHLFNKNQLVNKHMVFTRQTVSDLQQLTYMFARVGSIVTLSRVQDSLTNDDNPTYPPLPENPW